MLKFEPEDIDSARARLSRALEKVHDPRLTENLAVATPGTSRDHVFDFHDGLRLVVSRDILDATDLAGEVHVSASIDLSHGGLRLIEDGVPAFIETVRRRWKELGRTGELEFLGLSPGKKVPHFVERALQ